MHTSISVTPAQLPDVLLHVAVTGSVTPYEFAETTRGSFRPELACPSRLGVPCSA